jgi:hypothetical protein
VRILMAKVFPYDSGYMQTVTGRRRRLREALGTGRFWHRMDGERFGETLIPGVVLVRYTARRERKRR